MVTIVVSCVCIKLSFTIKCLVNTYAIVLQFVYANIIYFININYCLCDILF